jgi:CO/xanthine dehydrogenase FAD-binding subunit
MKKNVLEDGEFLLKVTLSKEAAGRTGSYQKLRVRESWDFPEAGVAASWIPGDVNSLQIATTALESIPRCHPEEVAAVLEDGWNGMASVKALASGVRKSVQPVNNTSLPPRYRKSMVRVLTKRAVQKILE